MIGVIVSLIVLITMARHKVIDIQCEGRDQEASWSSLVPTSHRGTPINNHVYYRDTVVIGGSLAALLHAFHNNFPLYYIHAGLAFSF